MQERSQSAQEAADIPQQLVRGHQDHDDQGAFCQLLGLVPSAVQAIPATLLAVAALVTAPVCIVICTVLVILACPAILLTLKVVKQALGRVAELVTLSIEKHPAAQRGGAVGPRILHCQGAVASVPLARMSVTVFITIAIPGFFCTLGIQTSSRLWAESYGLFTVAALGVDRALTVIVRRLRMRVAAAPILAGGTGTTRVSLAFLSHRELGAIAPGTRRCLDALLPLLAFHLSASTVAAELTFCSRVTRRTLADEAIGHIAGDSAGTTVLTRLPGTHVYHTLTVTTSEGTATDAPIIICQLDTVQAPSRVARIGEALVDIPLAALSCEALRTEAAVAPDLVNALPSIEAAGNSRV